MSVPSRAKGCVIAAIRWEVEGGVGMGGIGMRGVMRGEWTVVGSCREQNNKLQRKLLPRS